MTTQITNLAEDIWENALQKSVYGKISPVVFLYTQDHDIKILDLMKLENFNTTIEFIKLATEYHNAVGVFFLREIIINAKETALIGYLETLKDTKMYHCLTIKELGQKIFKEMSISDCERKFL
jgi:hypothetical protein